MVQISLRHVSAQTSHLQREHDPRINAATLDEICCENYNIATLSTLHSLQLTHIPPEGGILMPKHVAVSLYTYSIVHWFVKMNMPIRNAQNKH